MVSEAGHPTLGCMRRYVCFEEIVLLNVSTLQKAEADPQQRQLLKKLHKVAAENASPDGATGTVETTYASVNAGVGGRLYAKGPSLQSASPRNRSIISVPAWEFGMLNAHPALLRNVCNDKGVPCPVVDDCVANLDAWVASGASEAEVTAAILGAEQLHPEVHAKVARLREEMKEIAAALAPSYAALQRAVDAPANLVPYILQQQEARVMADVLTRLDREFPSLRVQAYMFDSFLVRRSDEVDPENVLGAINSWAATHGVTFRRKPFECPSDFVLAPEQQIRGGESDVDALRAVCFRFPDCVKMNGPKKMAFDASTGLWTEDVFGAFGKLLITAHAGNNYGRSVHAMESVWRLVVTLPDDSAFFQTARRNAKGKLLFRNGIWDKRTNTRLEFTPSVWFAHAVPHGLPAAEPDNVSQVDAFHFTQPYPEPGVADWRRQVMTRAVFGLGGDTMTFECGRGSNGKSKRALAYQEAFGNKIAASLDGKHMIVDKFNNSSGASPQLMELKDARLVFVNDPPKDAVVDMSLLKKLTGGDPIKARGLYKGLEEFITLAMMQFNVNSMPQFSECEESFMKRRFFHLESVTRYDKEVLEDDPESHVYRADDAHVERMIQSTDALIWILIREPLRDVPVPESVKVTTGDTLASYDPLKASFDATFEKCSDGKAATSELVKALGVTAKEVAARLYTWGFGRPKTMRIPGHDGTVNGYSGLRKRQRDESGDAADDAADCHRDGEAPSDVAQPQRQVQPAPVGPGGSGASEPDVHHAEAPGGGENGEDTTPSSAPVPKTLGRLRRRTA